MATRIRLRRMGAKKAPFYRVVVADSRFPRDGRFIEEIGYYDPTKNPSLIKIDGERAAYWLGQGALPSETVRSLMEAAGISPKTVYKQVAKAPAAADTPEATVEAEAAAEVEAVVEVEAAGEVEAVVEAVVEVEAAAEVEAADSTDIEQEAPETEDV